MFLNWLRYDGVEILNTERTLAYAEAGVLPARWTLAEQPGCEGLATVLGHDAYRTPDYDEPPWYNVSDPATRGFAGLLPIDVTGLEGSSFTGEVTENLGAGGTVTTARRATKTFAATALLIGDSDEALHAGLEWLTGVVLRRCGDTSTPATLEMLTACPSSGFPAEDVDAPLVTSTVELDDPGWLSLGGVWDYDSTFTVTGTPPDPGAGLPVVGGGGPSDGAGLPVVGGGGPADSGPVVAGGGGPVAPAPFAVLAAPVLLDCLTQVVITWHVNVLPGATAVGVQPAAVDGSGNVLRTGPIRAVTGPTTITWTVDYADWAAWRPALLSAPDGFVITSATVARHPDVDPVAWLRPYRRTYTRVKCVEAPVVTTVFDTGEDGDGAVWQIEWTWAAEDPYRYLDPVMVANGVRMSTTRPTESAPGVIATYNGSVSVADTDCPLPVVAGDCASDPTLPQFTPPPVAPVIGRSTAVVPKLWRRSLLALDPTIVPALGEGALTLTLHNDVTPKRGIRVRTWRQTDPDFSTHDECGFESELWIDYIDNSAVLTIDTVLGTVTAVCDDDSLADAQGVMHGPYQGAFVFPTIACGERYWIAVDLPTGQGSLTWDLAYATREG